MSDKIRGFKAVSRCWDMFQADGGHRVLPKRSTKNSAGYDFFAVEDIVIPSHLEEWIKNFKLMRSDGCSRGTVKPFCIKTGVKAYMQDDEVLQLYIRSSSPGKLGLILANSVGIVDSDYYDNPDNEGEIGFLVYNLSFQDVHIHQGDKIGQGVFTKYLKIDEDVTENERIGGFGSTGV